MPLVSVSSGLELLEHIPKMRRVARILTRNNADNADDLVQDALETAIRRFEQFEPGTNLQAWLLTILRNKFIDQCRRHTRRGPHVELSDWNSELVIGEDQTGRVMVSEAAQAFSDLPADQREALHLVAVEGETYAQTADRLGVPVGTVRSRVSRARQQLRDHFEPGGKRRRVIDHVP